MPLRSATRLEAVDQFSKSTSLMKKILVVDCENNEVHRIAGNCFMKGKLCRASLMVAVFILLAGVFVRDRIVFALDGQIGIHDPSTVILCDGKFYTFGTGGMSLVSDDGWVWRRGAPPRRRS